MRAVWLMFVGAFLSLAFVATGWSWVLFDASMRAGTSGRQSIIWGEAIVYMGVPAAVTVGLMIAAVLRLRGHDVGPKILLWVGVIAMAAMSLCVLPSRRNAPVGRIAACSCLCGNDMYLHRHLERLKPLHTKRNGACSLQIEKRISHMAAIVDQAVRETRALKPNEKAALLDATKATAYRGAMAQAVNAGDGPAILDSVVEILEGMREDLDGQEHDQETRRLTENAMRGAGGRAANRAPGGEWRSVIPSESEMRALNESVVSEGGASVPVKVSSQHIDRLIAASVFLRGLPASSIVRFDPLEFQIPAITGRTGTLGVVAEGTQYPANDRVWGSKSL